MNAPVPALSAPTPYKFTLDEARRLWASGVLADYPNVELIDGVLVEMPADGPRTINWNERINRWLAQNLPLNLRLIPDKTLALPPHSGPSPDFYIHDRAGVEEVDGRNVLLVIEVSDTTLDYDNGAKAEIYAKGGVREYWVADCVGRQIWVHRLGADGAYGTPVAVAFDQPARALFVPGLELRLSTLGLPD